MKPVGIICEYNPYHAGHARQLSAARREAGADVVIAVMSEHTTQRGELAVADGYVRAEAALRCGADLVIGLPFPYSSSPAEFFALGGVRILNALGADALHFGSESGDIDALRDAASRVYSPPFLDALTQYQQGNPECGIMQCRATVYEQCYSTPLPGGSNDLLAMAYLAALDTTGSTMCPLTIRRRGQAYNETNVPMVGQYPSATALRALWQTGGLESLRPHLPSPVLECLEEAMAQGLAPLDIDRLTPAILAFYRTASADNLTLCAEVDGGLAARLIEAAKAATTLSEFFSLAATKRYTTARLRRAVLFGLCGVRSEDLRTPPSYVRLLAASHAGCDYLSSIRKTCPLPILTKPADIPASPEAQRQRMIEERLEALVTLTYPTPKAASYLIKQHPTIQK
ncbi:MAG: nucleotidyltransferase family protein [Ruminococcaceae bacterium]|nr:nucleotidyltransferase family protein [Oscillospiraceae bacterium]